MKSKYDRSALKLEFIESKYDEVKWFIEAKNIPYHRQTRESKKWRTKEKQEHKAMIVEEAIKLNAEKQAKELSIPLEDLMKWKKAILWLLLKQVSKYVNESRTDDWKDIDVWNAERILKMFKTELWEPSTIWTNYNLNANKIEWLTEEESEALDMLLNTKSQKVKKAKTNND
jgi:hypothetical protein